MFGLFNKKSPLQVLQDKYASLMEESFKLSTVNRAKSDEKVAEADKIMKQIEALQGK